MLQSVLFRNKHLFVYAYITVAIWFLLPNRLMLSDLWCMMTWWLEPSPIQQPWASYVKNFQMFPKMRVSCFLVILWMRLPQFATTIWGIFIHYNLGKYLVFPFSHLCFLTFEFMCLCICVYAAAYMCGWGIMEKENGKHKRYETRVHLFTNLLYVHTRYYVDLAGFVVILDS